MRTSLTAAFAAVLLCAGAAHAAQRLPQPRLTVSGAWSRPTPPGAPTAVGYLTVVNTGAGPDRLIGAASPTAKVVEVHEMSMTGGVMRMRPVAGGVAIPAGGQAVLAPGGYHLMLIGPVRPLKAGDKVPLTLRFERAGLVEAVLDVGMGPKP